MPEDAVAMYIVLHIRDMWWVDFEGLSHGPYDSKETAAAEAADLAQDAAELGRRSEVRVPGDDGHYWAIWHSRVFDRPRERRPLAEIGAEAPFAG